MKNCLTVDVEDYFHPSEVQREVGAEFWGAMEPRVADSTARALDLFARHGVKATFFVLGWVAERHPALVRRIAGEGHEVACHSYAHRLVYDMTPDEFREDTLMAVKAIEDAAGVRPRAYRAPSYSITGRSMWALEVLAGCGFRYDSSIYPVAHDRYGVEGFSRHAIEMKTASGTLLEVPPATVKLAGGQVAPIGGGGYLRLLPYRYTAAGVRRVNCDEGQPVCLYFHPWEIDPGQPRLLKGRVARLRTYTGLASMERKLERLLREFEFAPMSAVYAGAA